MNSFYNQSDLISMGFKSIGQNVFISKKASIYGAKDISIGNNVRIDDFCILSGNISIGNYVHIAPYSAIYGGDEGVEIKDFANISSRVSIYGKSDDYSGLTMTNPMIPDKYKNVENKMILIDRHVIIGTTSVVLPGSILQEGCAFGSFSLIKGDYKGWGVYAGIPAKRIKDRKKNILDLEKRFLEDADE